MLANALVQNGRVNQDDDHICGMHALNICFRIWGYSKQYTISTYPYKWILNPLVIIPIFNFFAEKAYLKWGLSGS